MSNPLTDARQELKDLIKKHWFCQHPIGDPSLWLERHVLDRGCGGDSYTLQRRADALRAHIKLLERAGHVWLGTSSVAHKG